MSEAGGTKLDDIARGLAGGGISRRSALKRLAGAGLGLGAALAPAGVSEALAAGCPPGRKKCGKKCCPENAKCKNGKCKCKSGYSKCGKKCCSPAAAGSCQQAVCDGGQCGTAPDDSNVPTGVGECNIATCNGGTPVITPADSGTPCTENGGVVCDGAGNCSSPSR